MVASPSGLFAFCDEGTGGLTLCHNLWRQGPFPLQLEHLCFVFQSFGFHGAQLGLGEATMPPAVASTGLFASGWACAFHLVQPLSHVLGLVRAELGLHIPLVHLGGRWGRWPWLLLGLLLGLLQAVVTAPAGQ